MFSDPIKNLRALGLGEYDVVADLGAGTGFYSIGAGQIVTRGKVYAVDVAKDFLRTIKKATKEAKLDNIEIIWGDVEKIGGTRIGDGIVDAVIAANVLFQLEDKDKFVLEIKRILKKGGKVLLVDWSPESYAAKGAIKEEKAREIFEKNGFIIERSINTGDHHYGMIIVNQ